MVLLHVKAWHHADTLKYGQFLDLSLLNCAEQKELDMVIVLFILKAFFTLWTNIFTALSYSYRIPVATEAFLMKAIPAMVFSLG